MANPNPNDTKFEQQRSDAAIAALKEQTENNHKQETEEATDSSADNAKKGKE